MLKTISLLTRKPNLSHEEFIRHWTRVHAPLAHAVPGLRRYVQSHIRAEPTRPDIATNEIAIDGIAELWFDDQAALARAHASPEAQRLFADGALFIGRIKTLIVEEVEICSNPRDAHAEAASETPRPQFFEGFKTEQIRTSGAAINTVYGGNRSGPPLLLLHGIPQTHVLWRKVAPRLAQDYFVVMTDLRGYGDSSKPPGGGDHFAYSKRAMAQDQVDVMRHLGFEKFAVVGHDRGGRAAHRLALDHPAALTRLVILDIVPTHLLYQNMTQEFATIFYHWFLLVQPPPFPETLVQNSAEYFLKCTLLWLGGSRLTDPLPEWISPAAFQEYLRTFSRPETIHAICEDYRAAASIDLAHDQADLDKKIQCPLLVLWSEKGPFHRLYDVLQTWRERAVQAQGEAMPTGHFLPEQMPQELTQEITRFLREGDHPASG